MELHNAQVSKQIHPFKIIYSYCCEAGYKLTGYISSKCNSDLNSILFFSHTELMLSMGSFATF